MKKIEFFSFFSRFFEKIISLFKLQTFLAQSYFSQSSPGKNFCSDFEETGGFFEKRDNTVWDSEKEWEAMVSMRRIISIIPKSSENEEKEKAVDLRKD